jgi:hypothetical protein
MFTGSLNSAVAELLSERPAMLSIQPLSATYVSAAAFCERWCTVLCLAELEAIFHDTCPNSNKSDDLEMTPAQLISRSVNFVIGLVLYHLNCRAP